MLTLTSCEQCLAAKPSRNWSSRDSGHPEPLSQNRTCGPHIRLFRLVSTIQNIMVWYETGNPGPMETSQGKVARLPAAAATTTVLPRLDTGRRVGAHTHPDRPACSGIHFRSVVRFARLRLAASIPRDLATPQLPFTFDSLQSGFEGTCTPQICDHAWRTLLRFAAALRVTRREPRLLVRRSGDLCPAKPFVVQCLKVRDVPEPRHTDTPTGCPQLVHSFATARKHFSPPCHEELASRTHEARTRRTARITSCQTPPSESLGRRIYASCPGPSARSRAQTADYGPGNLSPVSHH